MRRTFLLVIFFIVLIFALFYKSPFSALYNYNQAKALYDSGKYEQSLPYFEKSLFADSKGILARFFYVMALSKSKPVFSVQKKLYKMADSKIADEASKYAKSQILYMKHNLLKGLENNYIYNAADGNDILRWDIKSFPLNVYFENSNDVPSYYVENIKAAMNQWVKRTNFIQFNEVLSATGAQIVIKFENLSPDACIGDECKYAVAYTNPEIDKNKILKKMDLTFYKTNPRNEHFTQREIFNTALHEIGHTLGIMGHSDNPNDAMYPVLDNSYYSYFRSNDQSLSSRDLRTMVLLYRIEPTITNTKNLHDETFYYAPLVIGEDDVRLQKKLEEYQKYIEDYPNMAAGYINSSSVYADLGDFDSALNSLNIAENVMNGNDERYLVYFNKAVVYFNKQNYTKSLEFAKKAQSVKNDSNVQELIEDIRKVTEK